MMVTTGLYVIGAFVITSFLTLFYLEDRDK